MEEEKSVNTGLYITTAQLAKLERIAVSYGVSRNRMVAMLIDSVDEVERPKINVRLPAAKKEKVLA